VDKNYIGGDEAAMQKCIAMLDQLKLASDSASPVISLARIE